MTILFWLALATLVLTLVASLDLVIGGRRIRALLENNRFKEAVKFSATDHDTGLPPAMEVDQPAGGLLGHRPAAGRFLPSP